MAVCSKHQGNTSPGIDLVSWNGDGFWAFKKSRRSAKKRFLRTRVPRAHIYCLQEVHAAEADEPSIREYGNKIKMRVYLNPATVTEVQASNRDKPRTFTKHGTAIMVSESYLVKNNLEVKHEIIVPAFLHMVSLFTKGRTQGVVPEDSEGKVVFRVYNVYLKSGDAALRRSQMALLADHVKANCDKTKFEINFLGGGLEFSNGTWGPHVTH